MLGEKMLEHVVVAKILSNLHSNFKHIVLSIVEAKDLGKLMIKKLGGSLKSHEAFLHLTEDQVLKLHYKQHFRQQLSHLWTQEIVLAGVMVEDLSVGDFVVGVEEEIVTPPLDLLLDPTFSVLCARNLGTLKHNAGIMKKMLLNIMKQMLLRKTIAVNQMKDSYLWHI